MRWIALIFALCLGIAAWGDPEIGMLNGTATFEDGTPCAAISVEVVAGEKTTKLTATPQGGFSGMFPVGKAVVRAGGASAEVTIVAGERALATLTVPFTGVMLSVALKGVLPKYGGVIDVTYAYRTDKDERHDLKGQRLAADRHWLSEVPAEALALSVIFRLGNESVCESYRQEWTFTEREEKRRLTAEITFTTISVQLLDAAGHALPNVMAEGRLYSADPLQDPFWAKRTEIPQKVIRNFMKMPTDAEGWVNLGIAPAQKYLLEIRANGKSGTPVLTEATDAGTLTENKYQLSWEPRTVRQKIFDRAGKPAPRTAVHLSYCWEGRAAIIDGRTDADGVVTWTNLPPTNALVWGEQIPVGWLPWNVGDLSTPMAPCPPSSQGQGIRWKLAGLPEPAEVRWTLVQADRREERISPPSSEGALLSVNEGTPFSLAGSSNSADPATAALTNCYLPSAEPWNVMEFTLTANTAPILQGKFVGPDGKPIAQVSRLTLAPDDLRSFPDLLRARPIIPSQPGDGTFSVALPGPGRYRLQVDLFGLRDAALPGSLIDIKPGNNNVTLTLPAPLMSVPTGSEVRWVTDTAPSNVRTLTIPGAAGTKPIFGPADRLLACWCRVGEERLQLWRAGNGMEVRTRRMVQISPRLADGTLTPSFLTLTPLMPACSADRNLIELPEEARPEVAASSLSRHRATSLALWPGKYAVFDRALPPVLVGTVTIPANGPREVTVTILPSSMPKRNEETSLQFPPADYATLAKTASSSLRVTFNDSQAMVRTLNAERVKTGRASLLLPPRATTMTIQWLGVGVIEHIPITPANYVGEPIKLPEWKPGITANGHLFDVAGKPMAAEKIVVIAPEGGISLFATLTTDAVGAFSVNGVLPGPLDLSSSPPGSFEPPNAKISGNWHFIVPPGDTFDLRAQVCETPMRLNALGRFERSFWWMPDTGPALLLNSKGFGVISQTIPESAGWVWSIDKTRLSATCHKLVPAPGSCQLSEVPSLDSSLGLYLPMTVGQEIPGVVTLLGRGRLAAFTISLPPSVWTACPEFDAYVGQVPALPPGDYHVIVDTSSGPREADVIITEAGGTVHLPAVQ